MTFIPGVGDTKIYRGNKWERSFIIPDADYSADDWLLVVRYGDNTPLIELTDGDGITLNYEAPNTRVTMLITPEQSLTLQNHLRARWAIASDPSGPDAQTWYEGSMEVRQTAIQGVG